MTLCLPFFFQKKIKPFVYDLRKIISDVVVMLIRLDLKWNEIVKQRHRITFEFAVAPI